ncbi:hypothetical protein R6Q59_025758 [Mikania micrantha]
MGMNVAIIPNLMKFCGHELPMARVKEVYGLSCVNDSNAHGRKNHENEKLNEIIKEILKEKEEEKERLNGIIAELEAEKEKHKEEKEAMSNRMSKIEDMLKTLVRK